MSSDTRKPLVDSDLEENLKNRLIPFPVRTQRPQRPRWPFLTHYRNNPFVRFLRTVFYYQDEGSLPFNDSRSHGKPRFYQSGKSLMR